MATERRHNTTTSSSNSSDANLRCKNDREMSFVKKFMSPNSKKLHITPTSSLHCASPSSSIHSREKTDGDPEKSEKSPNDPTMNTSPDTQAPEESSDVIDLFLLETNFQMKRDNINQQFDKNRRLEKKMNMLRNSVTQLCLETEEIDRVLAGAEEQFPILLKEYVSRREELEEKLKSVTDKTKESEIKKREPIMYKKYMAIKSIQDSTHYLNLIQSKQKTLLHLELLALRKHSSLQQTIATKTAPKSSSGDKGRIKPLSVAKKPGKDPNLQSMYQELLKTFVQLGPLSQTEGTSSSAAADNTGSVLESSAVEVDQTTAVADLFATETATNQMEITSPEAVRQDVTLSLESEV